MTRNLPPGPLGGLLAPLWALGFLWRRPRMWWLAAAPLLVNLGLFAFFFWLGYRYFGTWLEGLVPAGEGWWWQVLLYLALFLAALLLLVVMAYLFSVLGRVLAAPFLELLTQQVEREVLGTVPQGPAFWIGLLRMIRQEALKLFCYLVLMGLLLVLNLLPLVGGMLYSLLALLVTGFFLALDFLDYPLERRGLGLGDKLRYTRRLGLTALAFGSGVFLLVLVPLLNLALLPLAAVGGTLLYLDHPWQEG